MKNDFIYDEVNKKIFEQLEKGEVPWRKPWKSDFPINLASKRHYEGFNVWILLYEQEKHDYKSNVWASFKQISSAGGSVKKGEKATMVIYWKILEFESATKRDKNGKPKIEKVPLLRYYYVFNLDQTKGIDYKTIVKEKEVNLSAEKIIKKYKKQVKFLEGGDRAFYSPTLDYIQLPLRKNFLSDNEYYATNFHEMTHSTSHATRLNRDIAQVDFHFGDQLYSKEELVAEMGSAYLCAKTKILPAVITNTGAYIQSWLKALKNDKTLLVSASGKAQKAVNYILDVK